MDRTRTLTVAALMLAVALPLAAQDAPAAPDTPTTALLTALIPFLVPIAIAALKAVLPLLPSWTLPVLAPLLGAGADMLIYYGSGGASVFSPIFGAVLGSAGVGVREIADQIKQRVAGRR